MFTHYRTEGLIIKKRDRGESNQLFTIYTNDFGKLEVLGKAIRKITSKLRAGAEIFYLSEIEFIQGKGYKTLTDAVLIESFSGIRKSLSKLKTAHQIAEALDKLTPLEEKDPKIWQLLLTTFKKLNHYPLLANHYWLIYYYFLWNFLSLLGHHSELYHCSLCQKKLLAEQLCFSPEEGGVICGRCGKLTGAINPISPETIKILRIILKRDWKTLERLKIEISSQKSLQLISDYYLSELLEQYK